MAKLSLIQLRSIVDEYVKSNKISVDTFEVTKNNTVGLLDKIGKILHIPMSYNDKLEMFDGEFLSFGKTVEEWAGDLILPQDFDASGEDALTPSPSTYRPVYFSFTLGRKTIKQTIRNNDIERAVHFEEQLVEIVAQKYKALTDSETLLRYDMKKQALAVLIARCVYAMNPANATAWSDADHETINALFKATAVATDVYTLVKKYTQGDASSFDDAVAKGYLIKNQLVEEIAKPVDTSTGEDFVLAVKKDVEIASDISEGHSLNANTLGATETDGLVLLMLQGINPVIDVEVLAGAFHTDKVALPSEIKVINGFGNDSNNAYAILMDKRAMRLHNTYRAVRENFNGSGDFLNLFFHTENTVHVSRNVYIKVYKVPSGS